MGARFKYYSLRIDHGQVIMIEYVPKEGVMRWDSANEKMYILKARKGCLPIWEEIDPFEDLEERKVKK